MLNRNLDKRSRGAAQRLVFTVDQSQVAPHLRIMHKARRQPARHHVFRNIRSRDESHANIRGDKALQEFSRSPFVLQRYHKPRVVDFSYFDFTTQKQIIMPSRVRLCPYYFVTGEGDAARAHLGGVLATACPSDKKIIHGMKDAILAPCAVKVIENE